MDYVATSAIGPLIAVLYLAATLAAVWRVGRALLGYFGLPDLSRAEAAVWSLGLGFIVLGLGIYALGLAGWFSKSAFAALWAALMLAPFFLRAPAVRIQPPIQFDWKLPEKIILGLSLVAVLLAFVQGLEPASGMDALAYHLYLPKEFLRLGRMEFLPVTRESLWPFHTEMFFMAGLRFEGTALAQLFHWIFYPLTAVAVFGCTRRYYGSRAAAWAAGMFVFAPAAYAQASYPYVDVSLAFFIFMAVFAFLIGAASGGFGAFALSGLFCGTAAGSKYLGLGCGLILAAMVLQAAGRDWRKPAAFAATAAATGSVWYVRSWILAGNPVFPLFPEFFGGRGWALTMDEGVSMGKGLRAFLLFPWNVTMFPNAFGGQMVGAIFLAFLPVLVLFWKKPRAEAHRIAFFTAAFIAFLFSQSQHVRFFIAAMPLLAVGTGVSIVRVLERGRLLRITAASTLVILIGLHAGIFVWRSRDSWPVVLGRTSAADWLAEHERSYRGFDFLKNHVPADASVLNAAEVRYFYSPDGWRITHLPHLLVTLRGQGASIETHLREARYEYVWVSNQSDPVILEYLRREAYQPIFHYDFAEKPDTFQNTIYRRVSQFSL